LETVAVVTAQNTAIYGSKDPRELPVYSLAEAARYLRMPVPTLRSWIAGRNYPVKAGSHFFKPTILLPRGERSLLSFVNLVEAHVLDAIRRQHNVSFSKVRQAIQFLRKEFDSQHPLADHRIETDGKDLFVEKLGKLITITRDGQLAMREILDAHLRRVEWSRDGQAARLYPFTRKRDANEPRVIVIDPRRSFGRPVLVGTGIPTAIVAERYKAGETVDQLADDYGRARLEIEEAIRCELFLEAA
jgi:uncharacterized protein (DUF433 family)